MTTDGPAHRPVIEVLRVADCPNYQGALALVERVRAELGIDADIHTTLIADQAATQRARFPGSPTVRVDGRDVEPGSEPPPNTRSPAACTGTSTGSLGSRRSAGSAKRCCGRPARAERPQAAGVSC